MIVALHDEKQNVRWAAALALGGIGPAAEPALPALTDMLKHEEPGVRRAAEQALEQIREE